MIKKKLAYLILCFFSSCHETIVSEIEQETANKIVSDLADAGIKAEKKIQGDKTWSIVVAAESSERAIKHLTKTRKIGRKKTAEKGKASFLLSREEEHLRFEQTISKSIEDTLESIDGVFEARVHLNLPQKRQTLFLADEKAMSAINETGTASVMVITDKNFNNHKETIAALVAGASGLTPESVSIMHIVEQTQDSEIILPGNNNRKNFKNDQEIAGKQVSIVTKSCLYMILIGVFLFAAIRNVLIRGKNKFEIIDNV